jgi:hypothetical protein
VDHPRFIVLREEEVNGDGGDGDGERWRRLRGHFPRTETSVPRNSSMAAAELRNSFWKIADSLRVFCPEASYRLRDVVRSGPRPPHT